MYIYIYMYRERDIHTYIHIGGPGHRGPRRVARGAAGLAGPGGRGAPRRPRGLIYYSEKDSGRGNAKIECFDK